MALLKPIIFTFSSFTFFKCICLLLKQSASVILKAIQLMCAGAAGHTLQVCTCFINEPLHATFSSHTSLYILHVNLRVTKLVHGNGWERKISCSHSQSHKKKNVFTCSLNHGFLEVHQLLQQVWLFITISIHDGGKIS